MSKILTIDIETRLDPEAAEQVPLDPQRFPPWPLHEILCVSILQVERVGYDGHSFDIETLSRVDMSEAAIVGEVERRVADANQVLTFNGRGFDVPVLLARAALTGVVVPEIVQLGSRAHTGRHADLLDEVTGSGAAPKVQLAHLCAAFGIPAKLEAAGKDVATLAHDGDLARVTRYCETDVVATWLAAQLWRSNQLQDLGRDSWVDLAAWIRSDQPRLAHLLPYATVPPPGGGRCLTPPSARVLSF